MDTKSCRMDEEVFKMNLKYLFTTLFIPLFLCGATNVEDSSKGYFQIQYSGPTSKPYSIFIFYLPNSIDTSYEDFFLYKIPITQIELRSITESVLKEIEDTAFNYVTHAIPWPIEMKVVRGSEEKILMFKNKEKINLLFANILEQFKGDAREDIFYPAVVGLLRRLHIPGIADEYVEPKQERYKKFD